MTDAPRRRRVFWTAGVSASAAVLGMALQAGPAEAAPGASGSGSGVVAGSAFGDSAPVRLEGDDGDLGADDDRDDGAGA